MEQIIDRIVRSFEAGRISRRELLGALVALAATGRSSQATGPSFQGAELNHLTLRVSDLRRSKEFYQQLLGLPLVKDEKDVCYLGLGKGFMSLWQSTDATAGFDHFCVGISHFDRQSARAQLEKAGIALRSDPGDPTIYVLDPDRFAVQFEAPGFRT